MSSSSQPLGTLIAPDHDSSTDFTTQVSSAASTGDLPRLESLISQEERPDEDALLDAAISAAQNNQPQTLAYLLDHGAPADPIIATMSVSTATPEMFQTLYDHGWRPEHNDPKDPGRPGQMPILLRAIAAPNTPLTTFLLPLTQNNPSSTCHASHTPLSTASSLPSPTPLLPLLLKHYPLTSSNALHAAARSPHDTIPTMALLLEHGIDMNALEVFHGVTGRSAKERGTALQAAIQANRLEKVEWLLEHGADGMVKSESGFTALDWAEQCGSSAEMLGILRAGGCQ